MQLRYLYPFYFRQSGHDHSGDKTFEFTHKSFGEYLTARRIVQEVRYIHHKLEVRYNDSYEDWDERRALHRWALVCGPSAIDEYLFDFVVDELHLHYQQQSANVATWQQTLCHLISFMLRHGMPMERLNPRPDFQEENRQAVNAEESLLAVLNACARSTNTISMIEWTSLDALSAWIFRLQGPRPSEGIAPVVKYLSLMNLKRCILHYKDLIDANLQGADLERANLQGAHLIGAHLEGAHLEGATLQDANLLGAYLDEAHLEGANLERANLEDAYLERANLIGAHLEGANLVGATLQDANLERASLEGAHLEGANLERANLQGANLQDAYLEGAYLDEAHLEGANLERANLEGANLERANLEGANLEGANLEGANLKGTILEGKVSLALKKQSQDNHEFLK